MGRFDYTRFKRDDGFYHCPCGSKNGATESLITHWRRHPACAEQVGWVPGPVGRPKNPPRPRVRRVYQRWTEGLKERFLEVLAETRSVQAAAKAIDTDPTTVHKVRRREPDFAAAWDQALGVDADGLVLCGVDGCPERLTTARLGAHLYNAHPPAGKATPAAVTEHAVQSAPRRGRTLHTPAQPAQEALRKPRAPRKAKPQGQPARPYLAQPDYLAAALAILAEGDCPYCRLELELHVPCTNECEALICPEVLDKRDAWSKTHVICDYCALEAAHARRKRQLAVAPTRTTLPSAWRREGSRHTGPETPLPLKKVG